MDFDEPGGVRSLAGMEMGTIHIVRPRARPPTRTFMLCPLGTTCRDFSCGLADTAVCAALLLLFCIGTMGMFWAESPSDAAGWFLRLLAVGVVASIFSAATLYLGATQACVVHQWARFAPRVCGLVCRYGQRHPPERHDTEPGLATPLDGAHDGSVRSEGQ